MIIDQGIDIVNTKRVERLYLKYGNTFLNKVFSKQEIELFTQRNKDINFLAKRFAAKEAFAKAIGFGFGKNLKLLDISTINNKNGLPCMVFSVNLKQKLKQIYGNNYVVKVSLSDEEKYAIASVIIYSC